MKTTKKKGAAAAVLLSLLLLSTLFLLKKDTYKFHQLSRSLWEDQMTEDTLSMHYTIAYPENWGLEGYEPFLPVYSAAAVSDSAARLSGFLENMEDINTAFFNDDDALCYKLLYSYLKNEQEESRYPYYNEPLSPSSGAQSQLPILLAEYAFRSKQDVEDYLALLDQTDEYFGGLLAYEQEKAAAGLFMPDAAAEKVIAQCDAILDAQSLADGSHFLVQTFEERAKALKEKELITGAELELYRSENDRLLTTVMLPAYQKLGDGLFLLKGSAPETQGLRRYPQGKEYYSLLVCQTTGSSRTPEQMKELLLKRFEKDYEQLCELIAQNKPVLEEKTELPDTALFMPENPEEILTDLQARMAEDFPAFPEEAVPACTVKTVSKSLEKYTSPAFYLTPPLDDVSENTIYINNASTRPGLSLYTTLAHEGYPGHLYQSVYSQLFNGGKYNTPVRNLLHYGGYIEGWALYVESSSYQYAEALIKDSDPQRDAKLFSCELERLDRDIQLCLYSLLDLAIHYDGASCAQVQGVLKNFGIDDDGTARRIYEYIAEEPANYLKYYIGYLEILDLKDLARLAWGENYTDKAFHTFFLQTGPCDFETLRGMIKSK